MQPGHVDQLATTFGPVCDVWYDKVPGVTVATVSRDTQNPNVVHEIRVIADRESFDAAHDPTDTTLREAMENWFVHYDTTVPISGELFAPGEANPHDDELHTSSIQSETTPRAELVTFLYGHGGMLGEMPRA